MTNPPGAMPPLPEPDGFLTIKIIGRDVEVNAYRDSTMLMYVEEYAKAYAAPLIARVAELERQNEAQKDEWLSWEAKRAALEKDAGRYRIVRRGQHWSVIDGIGNTLRADELDKQVDAAIAARKEQQP